MGADDPPTETPSAPSGRWTASLLVALVAAGAYAPTVRNGFVYDDARGVLEHPVVQATVPWSGALTHDFWGVRAGVGHSVGTWRPLVTLTFRALWSLGGAPWPFHLTEVLLHALASVLVFRVLGRRCSSPLAALVAAFVFAVHPLHSEAVASVVGLADVASFVGVLGALGLLFQPGPLAVAGGLGCALAALLCKESAVVPLALLPVLVALEEPSRWRAAVARGAALAAVVGLFLAARLRVVGGLQGFAPDWLANPLVDAHGVGRVLCSLRLLGHAVSLHLVPLNFLPDHGRNTYVTLPSPTPDGLVALGVLVAVGLGVVIFKGRGRSPWAVGGLWFLVPALPAVHLPVLLPIAFAERHWYLPSAGAALLAGEVAAWMAGRFGARWALPAWGLLVGLFGALTLQRGAEWGNETTLFSSALALEPDNAAMRFNLAAVLYNAGRLDDAARLCAGAAERVPEWSVPYGCLGSIAADRGDLASAERHFQAMLRGRLPKLEFHLRYVRILLRQGRTEEARAILRGWHRRGVWTRETDRLWRRTRTTPSSG
ncbi:MAG: tetratricopeptide repeat protein [Deltaproteobacteria bacterium]|nr:tetratricopeptide repeat protein [Deltaproteobacteria bacterium]